MKKSIDQKANVAQSPIIQFRHRLQRNEAFKIIPLLYLIQTTQLSLVIFNKHFRQKNQKDNYLYNFHSVLKTIIVIVVN